MNLAPFPLHQLFCLHGAALRFPPPNPQQCGHGIRTDAKVLTRGNGHSSTGIIVPKRYEPLKVGRSRCDVGLMTERSCLKNVRCRTRRPID
jgi:hypothetical protein